MVKQEGYFSFFQLNHVLIWWIAYLFGGSSTYIVGLCTLDYWYYAPIDVKPPPPRVGGGGNPRGFDIVKLSQGSSLILRRSRVARVTHSLPSPITRVGILTSKMVCWVRNLSGDMENLTFGRCPGVGKFFPGFQKMSKSFESINKLDNLFDLYEYSSRPL